MPYYFNKQIFKEYLKKKKVSKRKLRRDCGLKRRVFNRALRGDKSLEVCDYLKISDVTGIKIWEMFLKREKFL